MQKCRLDVNNQIIYNLETSLQIVFHLNPMQVENYNFQSMLRLIPTFLQFFSKKSSSNLLWQVSSILLQTGQA